MAVRRRSRKPRFRLRETIYSIIQAGINAIKFCISTQKNSFAAQEEIYNCWKYVNKKFHKFCVFDEKYSWFSVNLFNFSNLFSHPKKRRNVENFVDKVEKKPKIALFSQFAALFLWKTDVKNFFSVTNWTFEKASSVPRQLMIFPAEKNYVFTFSTS